ncbi:MAG TPA: hypothetical protein VGI39_39055 [Polyangiaceae bacterium]|jgi:hypothetical protein
MATPPSLAQGLLPLLDSVRGISGALGFRPISVTIRVISWPGAPSRGAPTSLVDTPLLVGWATQNPRVLQLTDRDVIASGGLYTTQDFKVGPLTPAFAASPGIPSGGYLPSQLDPPVGGVGATKEILFKLTGGGFQFPVWFERKGDQVASATRYFLVLRRSANQKPGGQP